MRSGNSHGSLFSSMIPRRAFLARSAAGAAGFLAGANLAGNRSWAGADETLPDLIIHTENPLNGEPPLETLTDSYLTPAKHFYIRGHSPIPRLDPATHTILVEGMVEKPGEYTLAQLQEQFQSVECTATMTCGGNRRREHAWFKPAKGVQWDAGAISNATWRGARLSEILKACGVQEGAAHVWFESLDEITQDNGEIISFGASIPMEKVNADTDDMPSALVAWEMNGEPLPPEHGFPLRTLVPGYIGARSVKWLKKIVVSDRPSPNYYWTDAYRLFTEETPLAMAESYPIYRYPINVAICESIEDENAAADKGEITVRGYALPSGRLDARIRRVQVSSNDGGRWVKAKLIDEPKPFCWVRWEATVPVRERTKKLVARAMDSTGAVTPDRVSWNLKGYMYNGWHSMEMGNGEG